jgi:flagellar motor switch protein FliN/FliY
MPLNPEYQAKLQKLAELIAVEASHKLAFLLNKTVKISFTKSIDSIVFDAKFAVTKNCFLLTSHLDNSELGSVNALVSNELVQCVADLVMGGDGMIEGNVTPDETAQTVFENSAGTLIESVIERLNSLKEGLGLKVKEHKQKQLLKNKSATLDAPEDLKDPIDLSFNVDIASRLDITAYIELGSSLVNYALENLAGVIDSLSIDEFNKKIKIEYFGESKPPEEDDAKSEDVIESDVSVDEYRNLGFLKDVNVDLIVELGRAEMLTKDILSLGKGSAIELDRVANQAVDLYIHNQLIARGEIVIIDECFGLKVTEILGKLDIGLKTK